MQRAAFAALAVALGLGAAPVAPSDPAPEEASGPAVPEVVTFADRRAAAVGDRWVEEARWHTVGTTKIQVGPATVRDKQRDGGVAWSAEVELTQVEGGEVTGLEVTFASARRFDGEQNEDLELDGVAVVGKGSAKRKWRPAAGGRLKRKARTFLDEQFGAGGIDPVELLLPGRPVAVGEGWDIDMDAIVELLGRDRFTLDEAASKAEASLEAVVERRGVRYGRVPFDVLIVPATITDGGFDEARMRVAGAVELPLSGEHPGRVLDVELETRFKGWVKRKGIRAVLDIDHSTVGREERR